jgi:dCMP deaminase
MRKSWDQKWLEIATSISEMSTCSRRDVGCVLVDHYNKLSAIGFNGVPPGFPHCRPDRSLYEIGDEIVTCSAATAPSGSSLESCLATHAEQNALIQCRDVYSLKACYTTASPCIVCVKMLLASSVVRIVYRDEYPHPAARDQWLRHPYYDKKTGTWTARTWEKLDL